MSGSYTKAMERFPVIRQSALSVFDNCALLSRFSNEYEQGWSSHPAARGQIVHRAIARELEAMEADGSNAPSVDRALAILDEVICQHDVPLDGNPLGDEVVSIPLREIAQARVTVKTWALYTRWAVEDFAGIEKRLETTLYYPNRETGEMVERKLTGKLDLLLIEQHGEHAIVVDFKDTWGIPTETRAEYAEDQISDVGYFQQRFYALLVFRHYPRVQHVTLREFYPRFASGQVLDKKNRPINPVREATVDRHVLPEIEREMRALVERFDRAWHVGKFKPAPGSHCVNCPRAEACTIFPGARKEGRIASQAEAEQLTARLNVVEALQKQIIKALRPWANAHGAVPVRDAKRPRVYGPVVRTRIPRPTREQVEAHVARGGNPADLYKPEEYVRFCVHTPDEVHPHAKAAADEEEALLAMERAAEERKKARSG